MIACLIGDIEISPVSTIGPMFLILIVGMRKILVYMRHCKDTAIYPAKQIKTINSRLR